MLAHQKLKQAGTNLSLDLDRIEPKVFVIPDVVQSSVSERGDLVTMILCFQIWPDSSKLAELSIQEINGPEMAGRAKHCFTNRFKLCSKSKSCNRFFI